MKKNNIQDSPGKKITRRESLRKAGALTLTTATMMLLMNSPARARDSVPDRMPQHGRPGRPGRPYPDDGK